MKENAERGGDPLYLQEWPYRAISPRLMADLPELAIADYDFRHELYGEAISTNHQLWIGQKGGTTRVHQDSPIIDVMRAQIVGEKHWSIMKPGVQLHRTADGALDFERLATEHRDDLFHVVCKPGDVIYLPALWWHRILLMSHSIGHGRKCLDQANLKEHMRLPASLADGTRGAVIQECLGGRIRYLWTGSAPISGETLRFYNEAGVALCEGYGLNETCIVAKNYPGAMKVGSAGRVLPHKAVRFDSDGAIIVGSDQPVNTRYGWCGPTDNAKIFLESGEVYTNDVGYLDEDGYLFIQGRKDDILVLSSGFNILPTPIEQKLSQHPAIRHLVLFGHGRLALVAVVDSALASEAEIRAHVAAVNERLLPEQRPAGVVAASRPFSLAEGTLGNQGKPVRRVIEELYRDRIEAVHARPRTPSFRTEKAMP